MKKRVLAMFAVVTFFILSAVPASAVVNDTIKVGLRYGSSAMTSANLENDVGEGYEFGYFDSDRNFVSLEWTDETTITMSPSGHGTIQVTVTGTDEVLYESDGDTLGVLPSGRSTATWFRGYRYPGGFEYVLSGGLLNVINVVDLEEYVKGVIPYEMSGSWPLAALEAQAVCARTYACRDSKHFSTYGFDVCNGTDCQVYNGLGSGSSAATDRSNQAVDNTAGLMLYYDGYLVQDAVYHASNGGATEDSKNVWGTDKGYLKGKSDPYEAQTSIPNYQWSVTYTVDELSWILDQKGYDVGTVQDVYVSEYTPSGNVRAVTFVGTKGTKTVTGETCRTIFYSSTYGKSVSSMRFSIQGGSGGAGGVYVNGSGTCLPSLEGISVISSGGTSTLQGSSVSVISSAGTSTVNGGTSTAAVPNAGTFTITGSGNGHNVGLSQYGAKAMAELGYTYEEILQFYYTDITIW